MTGRIALVCLIAFLMLAYMWAHPWLIAATIIGLTTWLAGRRNGRRGMARRVGRAVR